MKDRWTNYEEFEKEIEFYRQMFDSEIEVYLNLCGNITGGLEEFSKYELYLVDKFLVGQQMKRDVK